jgi:hypothetical protein
MFTFWQGSCIIPSNPGLERELVLIKPAFFLLHARGTAEQRQPTFVEMILSLSSSYQAKLTGKYTFSDIDSHNFTSLLPKLFSLSAIFISFSVHSNRAFGLSRVFKKLQIVISFFSSSYRCCRPELICRAFPIEPTTSIAFAKILQ